MLKLKVYNNKTNHLHEFSLCIVYKDNNRSFRDLLKKDNSITAHHRKVHSLDIELFKVRENFSNKIMKDILQTRTLTYDLGHRQILPGVLSTLVVLTSIHFVILPQRPLI